MTDKEQDRHIGNLYGAAISVLNNSCALTEDWELLDLTKRGTILMELRHDLQDALKSVINLEEME